MILTLLKMQLIILEANVFLFPLMFSYIKKYFIQGSKMISVVEDFIYEMNKCDVGEYVINSVSHDGCMKGYDIKLFGVFKFINSKTNYCSRRCRQS